jgi:NADPH:quinone reductase-like Zn-dependent oxidoreductase
MRAIVVDRLAAQRLVLSDVPVPEPLATDVVIRVEAISLDQGKCGGR